jgi:3-oxoacyl-[acyl-carrier-protein] synthase-3
LLQDKLGAPNTMAFDLSAACTGFLYGISVAQAYIESGMYKNVLLVGVDVLSKVVDWTDRNTCVLFGDGAGAAILQPSNEGGIQKTILGADGSSAELLYQHTGGSKHPVSVEAIQDKSHCLFMNGRNIFKQAVRVMSQACVDVLEQCDFKKEDVKMVIPHQANIRIIEAVADRLGIPMSQVYVNVHKYANTSAATIPMALHEAIIEEKIAPGDTLLFVSFGGGLTWGATLLTL